MAIQLYTSTRSASPRRTNTAAICLLAGTTGLAWLTVKDRASGDFTPRMAPPGWAVSFQVPRQFRHYQIMATEFGTLYQFYHLREDGRPTILEVHRSRSPDGEDAQSVFAHVVRHHFGRRASLANLFPYVRHDKTLGPFSATEVWDPALPTLIVRSARISEDSYAVAIVEEDVIDPAGYLVFEEACDSFQHQTE